MKKVLTTLLGSFLLGVSANAAELRLDDTVVVKDGKQSVVTAFREHKSCTVWRYIPGRYLATGPVYHDVAVTVADIGQQKAKVALSSLDMFGSPEITAQHLEQTKATIVSYLSTRAECKDQNITAASILLMPALVQPESKGAVTRQYEFFSKLRLGINSSNSDVYFDPTNPTGVLYTLDASDPETERRILDIVDKSQSGPVDLGHVLLNVQGILATVHSMLVLNGEMSAEFTSKVVQLCNSDQKQYDTGLIGGPSIPGLSPGVSETIKTCVSKIVTNFRGGGSKTGIKVDHSDTRLTVDDKPIMYTTCDEKGKCVVMQLSDFIEQQLYTNLILTNYDISKLSDATFELKEGRDGKSNVRFEYTSELLRRFDGKLSIPVPVYAEKLTGANLSRLHSPLTRCFQDSYGKMSSMYDIGTSTPMPIDKQCLGVK